MSPRSDCVSANLATDLSLRLGRSSCSSSRITITSGDDWSCAFSSTLERAVSSALLLTFDAFFFRLPPFQPLQDSHLDLFRMLSCEHFVHVHDTMEDLVNSPTTLSAVEVAAGSGGCFNFPLLAAFFLLDDFFFTNDNEDDDCLFPA